MSQGLRDMLLALCWGGGGASSGPSYKDRMDSLAPTPYNDHSEAEGMGMWHKPRGGDILLGLAAGPVGSTKGVVGNEKGGVRNEECQGQ